MRDGFKCTACGGNNILNVHHKVYDKALKYWQYPDSCLTTLCAKCHGEAHEVKPINEFYGKVEGFGKYKFKAALLKAFGRKRVQKDDKEAPFYTALKLYVALNEADRLAFDLHLKAHRERQNIKPSKT